MNTFPVVERFLRYVSIDTQSDPKSAHCPSTEKQFQLARLLEQELRALGLEEVHLNEHCYLMARLPSNATAGMEIPAVGFIAHLDTSPEASGAGVKPRTLRFTGEDITLDAAEGIILSAEHFPEMERYIGEEIIVTDGKTLLGADDKAGVAAIMEMATYFCAHPEIKHGDICIAFTPDEEIGRGADLFDVKAFGAQFAYTVDGGEIGELEYENFNAASAHLEIRGLNVHPGSAKDRMINALELALSFHALLPDERPSNTEGYEGFYHLCSMEGNVENATLDYIIRDHDAVSFELRKRRMQRTAEQLQQNYPRAELKLEIEDSYYNMKEMIAPHPEIIHIAAEAMRSLGIEPLIRPIRGGTDGARLSYMGLPCPNLFAGGHNFHGKYEFLPINSLQQAYRLLCSIIRLVWAKAASETINAQINKSEDRNQ